MVSKCTFVPGPHAGPAANLHLYSKSHSLSEGKEQGTEAVESYLTSLDPAISEEASNGLHTCHINRQFVLIIPSTSNSYSQRFLWFLF